MGIAPFGAWTANDPFLTANNLAGKYVYVSSGSGVGNQQRGPRPLQRQPERRQVRADGSLEVAASTSSQLLHRPPRRGTRCEALT